MDQQRPMATSSGKRPRAVRGRRGVATDLPIARVCVGVTPIHLDRPFDYEVPEALSAAAQPGCRVRIRFAGRLVDGFVLSREAVSDHAGQLTQLERVSGPPVVTASCFSLARAVADRYVGTLFDVLRMVVPARHARAERVTLAELAERAALAGQAAPEVQVDPPAQSEPRQARLPDQVAEELGPGIAGDPLLVKLAAHSGAPTRAVVTLLGADDAIARISELVCAAVTPPAGSRAAPTDAPANGTDIVAGAPTPLGAPATSTGTTAASCLVLVPDGRMATAVMTRLAPVFGTELARLTADVGPALRYATYLRILGGEVRVVVGTRAAVFAPLPNLALAVMWDDGDDLYEEPHAPGWHAREVLALRSSREDCHLIYAGYSRSVETSRMVHTGFLESICPSRAEARARRPEVFAVDASLGDHRGDASGIPVRVPPRAFEVIRAGLRAGPVLIQVARAGYLPAMACARCHRRAACPICSGPLELVGKNGPPHCRWCGQIVTQYVCSECGATGLRALAVGIARTAEELGRAFPGISVLLSGAEHGVRDIVPGDPALVVATIGAEPVATGGYAAAVLLDCDRILARPDIRAEEDAVRRWLAAAALVRCRSNGGREVGASTNRSAGDPVGGTVLLVGNPVTRGVQAVLRADPVGWAERELADRREARLPPAYCLAAVTGDQAAIHKLISQLETDARWQIHGPTDVPARVESEQEAGGVDHRYLVVAARVHAAALAQELRASLIRLSAGGRYRLPTVRVDPISVG